MKRDKHNQYVVGIDVGGTHIACILANEKGEILQETTRRFENRENRKVQISQLIEIVNDLLKKSGISFHQILGVGIGTPGTLDKKREVVLFAANLGWENIPLVKILKEKLRTKVYLENDANTAALGEWWLGAGRGVNNLILLTLGTGIGGGIIINGEVFHGSWNTAGEVGHMIIQEGGLPCGCGNKGCLLRYCSC